MPNCAHVAVTEAPSTLRSGSTSTAAPWSSEPRSVRRPAGSPPIRASSCGRCDYRGRYADDPATVGGTASILDGEAAESADRELHRRYGWQYNLIPLLKVPGVKNVDHDLALREKLRRVTAKKLWPDSAIVEVKLIRSDGRSAAPETASVRDDSQRRG